MPNVVFIYLISRAFRTVDIFICCVVPHSCMHMPCIYCHPGYIKTLTDHAEHARRSPSRCHLEFQAAAMARRQQYIPLKVLTGFGLQMKEYLGLWSPHFRQNFINLIQKSEVGGKSPPGLPNREIGFGFVSCSCRASGRGEAAGAREGGRASLTLVLLLARFTRSGVDFRSVS